MYLFKGRIFLSAGPLDGFSSGILTNLLLGGASDSGNFLDSWSKLLVLNPSLFEIDGLGLQPPSFSATAILVVESWELKFSGGPLLLWTSMGKEKKRMSTC